MSLALAPPTTGRTSSSCPWLRFFTASILLLWGTAEAGASTAEIRIDRDTGRIFLTNPSQDPVSFAGYTLSSPASSLQPFSWSSITDNYDADNDTSVDSEDTWFKLAAEQDEFSEATLGAATLSGQTFVDLGIGAFRRNAPEDVTFEYLDVGQDAVVAGDVFFFDALEGDFSFNGFVEQADLNFVLLNWGDPANPPPTGWVNDLPTGTIDQDELDRVLLNWGNKSAGFEFQAPVAAPLFGSAPGLTPVGVPEPGGLALATTCACLLILGQRRRNRC